MCKPTNIEQQPIQLPLKANIKDYQDYIQKLETMKGWLDVDLVHNCFLMGEEMGELFKAIRKHQKYFEQAKNVSEPKDTKTHVAEEIVDVFNYLLAIANRMDIDLEDAFRSKNAHNQTRSWSN